MPTQAYLESHARSHAKMQAALDRQPSIDYRRDNPITGRGLYAWCKRHEAQGAAGLLDHVTAFGQKNGYACRMVAWTQEQVINATAAGKRFLATLEPLADESAPVQPVAPEPALRTRHSNPVLKAMVRSPQADPSVPRRSPHGQARW
jgi:hypothetical protein